MINDCPATGGMPKRAALTLLAPALRAEAFPLNVSCDATRESYGEFVRPFNRICAR